MTRQDPLRDALRSRADQLGDTSPLSLDDVKGRARGIRRRRTAVSGLAAAAVLAIAVPAGIAVSDRMTGTREPDVAASPSATPTTGESTPDATPAPKGPVTVALTVEEDAVSYAPEIPYLYDGAIVRPDGTEVPVAGDYLALAPVGDGWAAIRNDEGQFSLDLLAADGTVTGSEPSTWSLASSRDGTVVAWATPDGELMIVTPDSAPMPLPDPQALPAGNLEPIEAVGSDSCVENASDGGCLVFFNSDDVQQQSAWSAGANGTVTEIGDLLALGGTAPDGSVSGLVSVSDTGSCSVVLGRDGGEQWKTCDYMLGRFSPDGRYVIGHPAYLDGIGDSSVAILDADTGDLLAEATNSAEHQSFINNAVWDSDNTLLASVFEEGTWSLMRMTAAGELTTVLGNLGDNMDEVPLVLPALP
jgi:hypothetical protein